MERLADKAHTLTPYERAACYYTLPRIAPPLPAMFVFSYAGAVVLLLIVLSVVALYGTQAQTYLVMLVVAATGLGGIFGLMARAVMTEVRTRRVLLEAGNAPSHETMDDSLPDPFHAHTLLRHTGYVAGRATPCTNNNHQLEYLLESKRGGDTWIVRTPSDESEMLTVRGIGGAGSFSLVPGQARRYGVFVGAAEVARIQDGGTLLHPETVIICHTPIERTYRVRDGGIHAEGRLVGREYFVHDTHYLDIEKDHLNEGTLGYFVSLV